MNKLEELKMRILRKIEERKAEMERLKLELEKEQVQAAIDNK